jgi:hypothetical protein
MFDQCDGSLIITHESKQFLIQLKQNLPHSSQLRFHSVFGCSPLTACVLWQMLLDYAIPFKEVHLLWTLYWLKHYPTEDAACLQWNCDPKTQKMDMASDSIRILLKSLSTVNIVSLCSALFPSLSLSENLFILSLNL